MAQNDVSHIPLEQCRKIFVQRDYTRGLSTKFDERYPPELHGYVEEHQWHETISGLNQMYTHAEKIGARSVFETLAGCLTCYLANMCIMSQYTQVLRGVSEYLEDVNYRIYIPRGLFITDPMERGMRVLEISFLRELAQPSQQPEMPDNSPRPANLLGNR